MRLRLAIALLVSIAAPLIAQAPKGARAASRVTKDAPVGAPRLDSVLRMPLERTTAARARFTALWRAGDHFRARTLYETYMDSIGANGLIASVRAVAPGCHDEGHDLGKVIFARLGDVNEAFRACDDACNSGCMHGVVTEFFAAAGTQHQHHTPAAGASGVAGARAPAPPSLGADEMRRAMSSVCNAPARSRMYLVGDCAHGVGHAAMFLARYAVDSAVGLCELFQTHALRFYCATGAYMEYRLQRADADYVTRGPFWPCNEAAYPAACFRYKLVSTFARHYRAGRPMAEIATGCLAMPRKFRLGCFHGIGNAHMTMVAQNQVTVAAVCRFGEADDRQACIEGVMERLGKFHETVAPKRCEALAGRERDVCRTAAARKMYDLERSFALYPR